MEKEGVVLDLKKGQMTIKNAGNMEVLEIAKRAGWAKEVGLQELSNDERDQLGRDPTNAEGWGIATSLLAINRVLVDRA